MSKAELPEGTTVRVTDSPADLGSCFELRRKVFIEEQSVPEEDEWDGLDDSSTHVLCELDGEPVATGRIRFVNGEARLERIAVLARHRGKGIGKAVTLFMMETARDMGATALSISSQRQAEGFYAGLGFVAEGETYMDAGIEHVRMVLRG